VGYEADVAEFNDKYMGNEYFKDSKCLKMGLGIDEVLDSSANISRKNYLDYFPEKPYPEDIKIIGNTLKSKKMPEHIAKFLDKAFRLLLQGNGQGFLNEYYSYIEKIYNYQIPLRDIASKGKIKKSIAEYKKDVQEITKAGRPKSRQAWYELAILNNLKVDNGDTIYYINNGSKKSESDIKKVTKYYQYNENNEKVEITKDIDKKWKTVSDYDKNMMDNNKGKWINREFPNSFKEEELIFNCVLLPREIIESEEDTFCSQVGEELEYNVVKYIDQFNKRIKPLLVCFSTDIRSQIMIDNPKNRPYFTEEQCVLVSGQPNKASDQDTYEQLMTMEDKEIKFWKTYNLVPPFVEECGMGKWEDIVADYDRRMKEEEESGIAVEKEFYFKYLNQLSKEEIEEFIEDGKIPEELTRIIDIDPNSTNFISKKYNCVIGNINDILEIGQNQSDTDEE